MTNRQLNKILKIMEKNNIKKLTIKEIEELKYKLNVKFRNGVYVND